MNNIIAPTAPAGVPKLVQQYFQKVADQLASQSSSASFFVNNPDIGDSRENTLLSFLRKHLPPRCTAEKGGFIFDSLGNTSKQLDIFVANDYSLRFDHFVEDGKKFQSVEGTWAAISVKSTLSKQELKDAINNLGSIPEMPSYVLDKTNPLLNNREAVLRFPLKYIFAFDGPNIETMISNISEITNEDPNIKDSQQPQVIVVNNKYCLHRVGPGDAHTRDGSIIKAGAYHAMWDANNRDHFGSLPLLWMVMKIQESALFTSQMLVTYDAYFNSLVF